MKKNGYLFLLLVLVLGACEKENYELQSAATPDNLFQSWKPVAYNPLAYNSDSSWQAMEIIYEPFNNASEEAKCGVLEFFSNGKLNYFDCGFCGTPPLVAIPESQAWKEANGAIRFRGVPQWISGDYESRVVSVSDNQLKVIQEQR
ncbi:MAG: hypothetical protein ACK4TA_22850 [Saprospiraceae bacterium]